ncbi:hypothetical protein MTR_5g006825 [Medicago truncatula]|uniref:Uncharacterized protein n=1 Tax=Medicago truncatula TaxID=3880 RepID=A0A072UD74_MEDTR|nr:hypothetical protein MTR_5g006825 [Medicago truncatula]
MELNYENNDVTPRTRCAKGETPKNIYKVLMLTIKHQPKQKQLQKDTHTRMRCVHQSWIWYGALRQ